MEVEIEGFPFVEVCGEGCDVGGGGLDYAPEEGGVGGGCAHFCFCFLEERGWMERRSLFGEGAGVCVGGGMGWR